MKKITIILLSVLLISKSFSQTDYVNLKTNSANIPILVEYAAETNKAITEATNILKGFINNNTQVDF